MTDEFRLEHFARRFAEHKLFGGPCLLLPSEIYNDKRKIKTVIKSLLASGYIVEASEETKREVIRLGTFNSDFAIAGKFYELTDKAWNEVQAEKPDFSEFLGTFPSQDCAHFSGLPAKNTKWIFEHLADYRFAVGSKNNRDRRQPFFFGVSAPVPLIDGQDYFLASDEECVARVAEQKRQVQIRRKMRDTLNAGLRRAGILDESDPAVDMSSGEPQKSMPRICVNGLDMADWSDELDTRIADADAWLVRIQEVSRVLKKIRDGIAAYGGWEKFLADHHAQCEKEI